MKCLNAIAILGVLFSVSHCKESNLTQLTTKMMHFFSSSSSTVKSQPAFLIHFVDNKQILNKNVPPRDRIYIGNGALVHPQKVLTTYNIFALYKEVVHGEVLARAASNPDLDDFVEVMKLFEAPSFENLFSDMVLVTLSSTFKNTKYVKPCPVSFSQYNFKFPKNVEIGGWKLLNPRVLQNLCDIDKIWFVAGIDSYDPKMWEQESFSSNLDIIDSAENHAFINYNSELIDLGFNGGPVTLGGELIGIISFQRKEYLKTSFYKNFITRELNRPININ